jgi:hypothetical protein
MKIKVQVVIESDGGDTKALVNCGCEMCACITVRASRIPPELSAPWPSCYPSARRRNCCIWRQSLHP